MLRLKFDFKYLLGVLLTLFLIYACKDIPRDNILDPKNPSSYRNWVISIEAFVNTQNDQFYNEYLIKALNELSQRYPETITIAHYHRNVASFLDSLSIPDNEFIYEDYVNKFDSQKGVPDVFINGTLDRIKGSSTIESSIERIERVLLPLLKENSHFTIEPEVSTQGDRLSLNIKLARLGSIAADEIFVRVILVEQIDHNYLSRVVRSVQSSNIIPPLEPGEVKELKIDEIKINPESNQSLVIHVISNNNLIVKQSLEVSIP